MPFRVRSKVKTVRDSSPVPIRDDYEDQLPDILHDDDFRHVVKKLSIYFRDVIELPSTFEQLRTTPVGNCLRILVDHLAETCTNPAIVNALVALKWHYDAEKENQTLSESRSYACEIVAWRFLTRLSEREAVDYCLYELPATQCTTPSTTNEDIESNETSPLLSHGHHHHHHNQNDEEASSPPKRSQLLNSVSRLTTLEEDAPSNSDPSMSFKSLNALEIAAIANAKRFLAQPVVQKIITGIWRGDIIFWDSLSVHSTKKPRFYNAATADPFSRLRVPRYLKSWEVLFFAVFLCLYYAVLLNRVEESVTKTEIALFFWIAAFFYDELSEWIDAGSIFYATDIWNVFDMAMILIGFIFTTLRIIGVVQQSAEINDLAFNVLALEALFMIPRICSILSLSPYWGTLIPCLKEMGKDFLKFMVLVVIVYVGFLTTFSLVGRDVFTLSRMTGILTKIFYGSSSVGFEIMHEIDPVFGPPLMVLFITLSSFLLMGSLTGMLSNSFSRVFSDAKKEYLYVYSVYVLEASTSNRLTHFYPPFNLLAFIIFRPWRLVLASDDKFRAGRIILLKATHSPIVAVIQMYEYLVRRIYGDTYYSYAAFKGPGASVASRRSQRPTSSNAQKRKAVPRMVSHEDTLVHGNEQENLQGQIAQLTSKIDVLTALVMAMQNKQHESEYQLSGSQSEI